MRWWILGALVSLVAVAQARSQPRSPAGGDGVPIRVESRGNELYAVRDAPVAYARLEQLVVDIARPSEPGAGPIRVARVSPRQLIAWVLCVTNDGTLVVGERLHTFDADERHYVFTKGEIARSYRPLETPEGWLWLVEVDRKSTRLNSSHITISTLSLHDALPICRTDPRRARLTAAAHRLGPVRDQRRDARRRRAAPHLRCGRAALRFHEGRDRAKLPAARDAGRLALARRGRSEEHTSELQSHHDLHPFPTRRSSDLPDRSASRASHRGSSSPGSCA